ncbi:DUF2851 family protein [Urechidicola sp. KH5]
MKEDFLQYVWQHGLFVKKAIYSAEGESISVVKLGVLNRNSGPDFLNAQVRIADYLWAGNIEVHVNASDWYLHNHDVDKNYDNVILHVVWNNDTTIKINDVLLPTLELRQYISNELRDKYQAFFAKKKSWILCENEIAHVPTFSFMYWKEQLFYQRLEEKSKSIELLLVKFKNDWEATLFVLMARGFGLRQNSEAFEAMAASIDFGIIRKIRTKQKTLEALFFGMSHILTSRLNDPYLKELQEEYAWLKKKFRLESSLLSNPTFFRLRPASFPTIRLSQLAMLYASNDNVFNMLMQFETIQELTTALKVCASTYWDTHYNFGKVSTKKTKVLTQSFVELLMINVIIPIKFIYLKQQGKPVEKLIDLMLNLPPEKNSIVRSFKKLKVKANSAFDSQALLQLKNNYCAPQKCLQCAIGHYLLKA